MLSLPMMIGIVAVFALVQISIFKALPGFMKRLLAYWLPLAVAINFFGSFVILYFTGTAYFIGPMNLMSSIIFGLYIYGYKAARNVHKVKRGLLKFPTLEDKEPDSKFLKWIF